MKASDSIREGKILYIYTDGASRGNPGPSAWAYVLTEESERIIDSDSNYIGKTTNNRAEYHAVINGLEKAKEIYQGLVIVHSDSELLVKQAKGEYKVKNEELRALYNKMLKEAENFTHVEYKHVPRENEFIDRADNLCNETLDNKP